MQERKTLLIDKTIPIISPTKAEIESCLEKFFFGGNAP